MKKVVLSLTISLLISGTAQSKDKAVDRQPNQTINFGKKLKCPNASLAVQTYVKEIKTKKGMAQLDFEIGKITAEDYVVTDKNIFNCDNISSIRISEGASMHGGKWSVKSTYLIVHYISRVSGVGVENSDSVLSTVTLTSQGGDDSDQGTQSSSFNGFFKL